MEKALKREIVDAAEAIKKKIRKMREIEIDNNQALESVFKPVTEPLHQIVNARKQTPLLHSTSNEKIGDEETKYMETEDEETEVPFTDLTLQNEDSDRSINIKNETSYNSETDNDSSFQSLNEFDQDIDVSSWSLSSELLSDVPFGVRIEHGNLMMGSAPIKFGDRYIVVAERKYLNTPGLKELLLKKDVNLSLVTESDMEHYKTILLDTNAHRRDNEPNKPIKSNRGQKYMQVIKPLFKLTSTAQDTQQIGKGLPLTKIWKKNVDFIYWDDPNELVDRLKLLIASREAGNTGVHNEIISIIEELRERKIINK